MVDLEYRLRDFSRKFNHPEKAYHLLYCAAEQGKLSDLENQFTLLRQGVGENVKKFSVQLLIDYQEHDLPLHAKPIEGLILNLPKSRSKTTYNRRNTERINYSAKNEQNL